MAHEIVIYRSVPVICKDKHGHRFYGDIPVVRLNTVTDQLESVANTRGMGYAGRNRIKHR